MTTFESLLERDFAGDHRFRQERLAALLDRRQQILIQTVEVLFDIRRADAIAEIGAVSPGSDARTALALAADRIIP